MFVFLSVDNRKKSLEESSDEDQDEDTENDSDISHDKLQMKREIYDRKRKHDETKQGDRRRSQRQPQKCKNNSSINNISL